MTKQNTSEDPTKAGLDDVNVLASSSAEEIPALVPDSGRVSSRMMMYSRRSRVRRGDRRSRGGGLEDDDGISFDLEEHLERTSDTLDTSEHEKTCDHLISTKKSPLDLQKEQHAKNSDSIYLTDDDNDEENNMMLESSPSTESAPGDVTRGISFPGAFSVVPTGPSLTSLNRRDADIIWSGETAAQDEILVEASIVSPPSAAAAASSEDQPTILQASKVEPERADKIVMNKRRLYIALAIVIFIVAGLAVGLGVALTRGKGNSSQRGPPPGGRPPPPPGGGSGSGGGGSGSGGAGPDREGGGDGK